MKLPSSTTHASGMRDKIFDLPGGAFSRHRLDLISAHAKHFSNVRINTESKSDIDIAVIWTAKRYALATKYGEFNGIHAYLLG